MQKIKDILNSFGKARESIFFLIDFNIENYYIKTLKDIDSDVEFSFKGKNLCSKNNIDNTYKYRAVKYSIYKEAFDKVQNQIRSGNTYLLNLTFASKIEIQHTLKDIYNCTDAPFKLYFKDRFVCFSPERFIEIKNDSIYTYPMKGTIKASIPNAENIILNDQKEMAEHVMVVDLLRNDLAQVSKKVRVERFRYIDKIKAGDRELLQVSSKIRGKLDSRWQDRLGDIIVSLLPAGSITGAPKKSTTEIIKTVENYERGFFSGIFGIFDGERVDSSVMIRYIEKTENGLLYKSGGGITIDSNPKSEYKEMCEKIYVPFL